MHRRALAVVLLLGCSLLPAQNSTRKVRTAPGELAARAGSAVEWRKDLDAALADAKALGRPVFAFVATMPGSPMDRQDEVERYLMAGPFSWPAVVDLLNTQFVPVRFVPSREQQAARAMRPRQYIEPGWLVLQADGTELQRVHELTTLHPEWIVRRLGHALGLAAEDLNRHRPLFLGVLGVLERAVDAAHEPLAADHFRDDQAAATLALHQAAEGRIGHAGHGRHHEG